MTIDHKTLQDVATLAKLNIDDNNLENLSNKMNSILEMIDQISNTDTTNISPLFHPLEATQPLRADISEAIDNKDEIQNLSSHIEDNLYMVPKVLD